MKPYKGVCDVEFLYVRGFKRTPQRELVTNVLGKFHHISFTVDKLKKETGLRAMTLHRILKLLEAEQIIHHLESKKAYFACSYFRRKGCHHAAVCRKCGHVEEFSPHGHRHPKIPRFTMPVQLHETLALCKVCL